MLRSRNPSSVFGGADSLWSERPQARLTGAVQQVDHSASLGPGLAAAPCILGRGRASWQQPGLRSPIVPIMSGILLRPPGLLQARQEHADGRLSQQELRQHEDEAILQALQMQGGTGISVLSDGEYRRAYWSEAWTRVLAPFMQTLTQGPGANPWRGPQADSAGETAVALGAAARRVLTRKIDVDQVARSTEHEAGFLKEHTGGKPYKITLPGPGYILGALWGGPESRY